MDKKKSLKKPIEDLKNSSEEVKKTSAQLKSELDEVNALIAAVEASKKSATKVEKTATKVKKSESADKNVILNTGVTTPVVGDHMTIPKSETVESKATPVEKGTRGSKGSEKLISTLNRIYSFMQKNREEDIGEREKEASKAEDIKQLKELRHKELLEALSKLTGHGSDEKPTAEKSGENDSGGGILNVLGGGLGLKALKDKLMKPKGVDAAKGAAGAAEGVTEGAAKSATKVSKILEGAKGVLKFLQKIPGLSVIASGATLILDVKNAIEAHEAGQLDDTGLKKAITKSVGGALGGLGGAEIGSLLGGALGSVVPGVGTLVGGILGGTAGFFGGEKLGEMAAEKAFEFFEGGQEKDPPADPLKAADKMKEKGSSVSNTPDAAPAPAPASIATSTAGSGSTPAAMTPSMPTASPMGGSDGSSAAASPTGGVSPSSPAAMTPAAPPPPASGGALAATMQQNQSMKLDSAASSGGTTVTNNSSVSSGGSSGPDTSKGPLPPIRNKDATFERLVYYSTRVV
jgi:predicted lipid-binding transport protein (Tim44 family)